MDGLKIEPKLRLNKSTVSILVLMSVSTTCIAETATINNSTLPTSTKSMAFSWSGPYLGAYIGDGWANSDVTTTVGTINPTSYFSSDSNIKAIEKNGSESLTPNTFIGGVQFGDNWLLNNVVYGFVIDYGSLNLSDSNVVVNNTYSDNSGHYSISTAINTNWSYTVRGRLGLIRNFSSFPVLIYATGGLAVTKLEVSNSYTDTTGLRGIGGGSDSNILNGWTIGGGIEFPISQNCTIMGEYLYANLGSVNVNSSIYNATAFGIDYQSLVSPFDTSANLHTNFFKVGLNYKFNL